MNENTEQESKEEVAIIENNTALELNDLNLDQLITRIEELSSNGNPSSVHHDFNGVCVPFLAGVTKSPGHNFFKSPLGKSLSESPESSLSSSGSDVVHHPFKLLLYEL